MSIYGQSSGKLLIKKGKTAEVLKVPRPLLLGRQRTSAGLSQVYFVKRYR